jgi:hypothetical protein
MRLNQWRPYFKSAIVILIAMGLTACAETNTVPMPALHADFVAPPRTATVPPVTNTSPLTFISPFLACHQGYATDGTNHFIFDTTRIFKRANDDNWTVLRANIQPFIGLTNLVTHLGDGDYYDGKLYVVGEVWRGCGNVSNQSILVFDANTLERLDVISVSNQNHEVSGLVVVPEHGKNGVIYVTSFCDGTKIFRYDLKTFKFLGARVLQPAIPQIQGITYHSNVFYLSSDLGGLFTSDLYGEVKWFYNSPVKGSHEGLAYSQGTLRWLVDQGNGNSHIYYYHFNGFEDIPTLPAPSTSPVISTNATSSDSRTNFAPYGSVVLHWTNSADGSWELVESERIDRRAKWVSSSNTSFITNQEYYVVITNPALKRFYRLRCI